MSLLASNVGDFKLKWHNISYYIGLLTSLCHWCLEGGGCAIHSEVTDGRMTASSPHVYILFDWRRFIKWAFDGWEYIRKEGLREALTVWHWHPRLMIFDDVDAACLYKRSIMFHHVLQTFSHLWHEGDGLVTNVAVVIVTGLTCDWSGHLCFARLEIFNETTNRSPWKPPSCIEVLEDQWKYYEHCTSSGVSKGTRKPVSCGSKWTPSTYYGPHVACNHTLCILYIYMYRTECFSVFVALLMFTGNCLLAEALPMKRRKTLVPRPWAQLLA